MVTAERLKRSVDATCVLIRMQIDNSTQNRGPDCQLITKESLGYIFGFVDGYQLSIKLHDMDEKMKMLEAVMIAIFGKQIGIDAAKKSLELQRDTDFDESRKVGGQQAIDFLKYKTIPIGLSSILSGRSLDKGF
jgi:hypothetical protein